MGVQHDSHVQAWVAHMMELVEPLVIKEVRRWWLAPSVDYQILFQPTWDKGRFTTRARKTRHEAIWDIYSKAVQHSHRAGERA